MALELATNNAMMETLKMVTDVAVSVLLNLDIDAHLRIALMLTFALRLL